MRINPFLQIFWDTHLTLLKDKYAGLTKKRLELETEDFSFDELRIFLQGLLGGTPMAYLKSEAYFFDSSYYINHNVLVPRPETEFLVDLILKEKRTFKSFADVGTGSGVIGLSLLRHLKKLEQAVLIDIDQLALKVAQVNLYRKAYSFCSSIQVELLLGDRLSCLKPGRLFDLIVSNPPYIKATGGKLSVHTSVDSFEPHVALYLPDQDYQAWFELFFQQVDKHLNQDGLFFMEGHEDELYNLEKLAQVMGFIETQVLPDLTGRARFLKMMKG